MIFDIGTIQGLKTSPKATTGNQLIKILNTMQMVYDVEFQFCAKNQTGNKIVEILEKEQLNMEKRAKSSELIKSKINCFDLLNEFNIETQRCSGEDSLPDVNHYHMKELIRHHAKFGKIPVLP